MVPGFVCTPVRDVRKDITSTQYAYSYGKNDGYCVLHIYITKNCQLLCFNPHQHPLEYDQTVGAQRPRTWGGSTLNLGRNDRTWGGRGADRLWGGSTVNRGVIDPLYHSRHNGGDRQYECDRGMSCRFLASTTPYLVNDPHSHC